MTRRDHRVRGMDEQSSPAVDMRSRLAGAREEAREGCGPDKLFKCLQFVFIRKAPDLDKDARSRLGHA